jgi:hypothetical protein
MGIANQQVLSHLSIDDIPKSMLTNGGGSIHEHETYTENHLKQSNGNIDHYSSPTRGGGGGGGEVNEKNGESLAFNLIL